MVEALHETPKAADPVAASEVTQKMNWNSGRLRFPISGYKAIWNPHTFWRAVKNCFFVNLNRLFFLAVEKISQNLEKCLFFVVF